MGYPVVHFEINGPQAGELGEFYEQQFGWSVQPMEGMPYSIADTNSGGEGINGGFGYAPGVPTAVTFYIEVPDVAAALEGIKAGGGTVMMERTDMGPVVLGVFNDPAGNMIGLVESPGEEESAA